MTILGVGLDIGATKTLGVAIGPGGQVLARVRVPTTPGAGGVVDTAAAVVAELLGDKDLGSSRGVPVGVGVPGIVDPERGSVKHAVNLGIDGQWLPLGRLLAARTGRTVVVENDVNAAAMGATTLLTGYGDHRPPDLAYLSIGTGLAAGLVLDGRPRRGSHGAAGEVGHVSVDPAGPLCRCGQRGCLETMASGSALAAAWPESGTSTAAHALFAAAAAGDPQAALVRDRFAAAVASAVRLLCLTVDVDAVVLGGGVADVGAPLRAAVAAALTAQVATSPFLASLELASRLQVVPRGHPVAAVGAALLARPTRGGSRSLESSR